MAKFTINSFFKGVRKSGNFIIYTIDRDDSQGFALTMGGGRTKAILRYNGQNDRSFCQLIPNRFTITASKEDREDGLKGVAAEMDALRAKSVEAPIGELFSGFAFCEPAASNDETRYNLNAVYVHDGRMVATDGHRMHLRDGGFPVTDKPALLSTDDLRMVTRAMLLNFKEHGVTTYRWARSADGIAFFTESPTLSLSMLVSEIDGQFPDYKQVILEAEPTATIRTTGAAWAEALKAAPVVLGDIGKNKFRFRHLRIGESKVWVEAKDGERFEMPVTVENNPQRNSEVSPLIGVNADYLPELIDSDGELIIEFHDELSPLTFRQGPALGIVMPVRS